MNKTYQATPSLPHCVIFFWRLDFSLMFGAKSLQGTRPSNGVGLCSVNAMIQCPLLVLQLHYLVGLHSDCLQTEFAKRELNLKPECLAWVEGDY
jgi:hypothetical protein